MDVPELIPLEEYNPIQARLESSISWLLTKAYGENIPCDLEDPFYTDRQNQICVKHEVISGLVSSDLYCRACEKLFKDIKQKWNGHMSVMQALSRKGVYVMDARQSAVTEAVLAQSSPFQQDAHLSLIDALLVAYTKEVVTVERVVQAVRRFTSFTASSELPYDVEDSLLFWLNKVCGTVRQRLQTQNRAQEEQESLQRSRGSVSNSGQIPVMDDLLKDLGDGCCLATLISFYCPIALRMHDIAMSESLAIADSLFNLQLILDFCENKLASKVLHLTMNDLFYTSEMIKPHLLGLLADLFDCFELNKADCVEDVSKIFMLNNGDTQDPGQESPQKKARGPPSVPISNATKRSFQTPEGIIQMVSYGSMTDLSAGGQSMPPTRQPLLPKRLHDKNKGSVYRDSERLRRSRSFNTVGDREMRVHSSSIAWGEGDVDGAAVLNSDVLKSGNWAKASPPNAHSRISQQSTLTNVTNSNLLSNVSIDTEGSLDISTDSSVTLSELDNSCNSFALSTPGGLVMNTSRGLGPNVNAGDLEVQSITSSRNTARSVHKEGNPGSKLNPHKNNPHGNPHNSNGRSEPLQAAQVKPAKEKINNGHSKDFESGESQQKKSPLSPTKPARLTTLKDTSNAGGSGGDDSPSDSEYLTPSTEVGGFSLDFPPQGSEREPLSPQRHKSGMAFFVDTEAGLTTSTPRSGRGTQQSFTVEGQGYTEESAKAAGIPVVGSHEYRSLPQRQFGSPRSSSDGSDQELRKIHADHRETEGKGQSFFVTANGDVVSRPDTLNIHRKGASGTTQPSQTAKFQQDKHPSPKTSFAELSQRKGSSSEVSPESPSKRDLQAGLSLKEQFEKARTARTGKKTTFAALPNQTTWQETAKKSAQSPSESNKSPDKTTSTAIPSGSELLDVRLRLEERRRQIENEKRKMELQWDRQRQNVGKTAFMQVIHKDKDGRDSSSISSVSNSKVIPKTIPENKEISPVSPSHTVKSSSRTSQTRVSPSRNKVSRSQSERIPATQRPVHLKKPIASEAEDRLQEIMQKLETIDMTPQRSKLGAEESQTSSGSKLFQQDSLTNIGKQGEMPLKSSAVPADKVKRQFSRENIQSKIDGVKQRWFSGESSAGGKRATSTPPRPGSAQSGQSKTPNESTVRRGSEDVLPTQISASFTAGQTEHAQTVVGEQRGYSSSLDKLNTSLSDLQGEIMRLSLQQDQIKSLVKEEKRASPTPSKMSAKGGPAEANQEANKFYLYPREGEAAQPDIGGGSRSLTHVQGHPASGQLQGHAAVPPSQVVVGPSGGQYGSSHQYGMAPGNYPPQYAPSVYNGPPAPGVQPYVHQYNHTSPQHGYIYPPGIAGLPSNTLYQQGSMWGGNVPPPSSQGYPPHIPHTTAPPPPHAYQQHPPHLDMAAHTMTVTAHHTLPVQSSTAVSTTTPYNTTPPQPPSYTGSPHNSHPASAVQSPAHSLAHSSPAHSVIQSPAHSVIQSPAHSAIQSPAHSIPESPASSKRQSPARHTPSPEKPLRGLSSQVISSPAHSEGGMSIEGDMKPLEPVPSPPAHSPEVHSENEGEPSEGDHGGFFFAFEATGPVKPKPQLNSNRKKKPEHNGTKVTSSNEVILPIEQEEPDFCGSNLVSAGLKPEVPGVQAVSLEEDTVDRAGSPYTVPEAFVIGTNEEQMENSDLSELESRKEKFMALQNKRREEESRRKKKLEEERYKKKEEQRMKEEMSERKKADEKTRRDQIYQEYLKRKEEREVEEELARAGMGPVNKRGKPKSKVPNRPKSQPPSSLPHLDKNPASSHSSQEELRPRGRSPAQDRAKKALSIHESPTKHPREQLFSGDHPDSGQLSNLAYGGLTHRRPPTPDKGKLPPGYGDQANNNNTDHSGLKLFKKMSSKSNKPVISQAISHCCLAGTVNNDIKKKVLETLNMAEANHFLILFRDHSMQYRGLYSYNLETEEIYKIQGVGPKQITSSMMNGFYKYNSGAKHFGQITTTKHMSATVDALTLQNACWIKKKAEKKPPAGQY